MNLDTIMSNIYGQSAAQNFDSLNFNLGGGSRREMIVPRYVSVDALNARSAKAEKIFELSGGYNSSMLFGGAKKSDDITFDGIEYIDDANLKAFVHEFHLHGLVNTIRPGSVLVVPSKKTLNRWLDELEAEFKKEKIEKDSAEASVWLVQHPLPYREYIFDLPLRASENDNEGFDFVVGQDFPAKSSPGIIRRHNRGGHHYFFKFTARDDIEIANNRKMADSKSLKLLGKCSKNVYVLAGDIPEPQMESNVVNAAFSGGAKPNHRSEFVNMVRKYNGDIELAAYAFIGSLNAKPEEIAKHYSGNFVQSAFELMFAGEADEFNGSVQRVSINKVHKKHEDIVRKYKCKKSQIKMDKVQKAFDGIIDMCRKASNGALANKIMMDKMGSLYRSIGEKEYNMKSDIAASICMNADAFDAVDKVRYAFAVCDGMNTQTGFYSRSARMGSPLTEAMYNALSAHPFIGNKSREYAPLPLNAFEDETDVVVKEVPVEKIVEKEVIVEKVVEKKPEKEQTKERDDECEEECEEDDDDPMGIKEVEDAEDGDDVVDVLAAYM
jgi:hypothetical protein